MKLKKNQLILICIVLAILRIISYFFSSKKEEILIRRWKNSEILKMFPKNNFYITNNNMALYSAYIIIHDSLNYDQNDFTIEAIAEFRIYRNDLNLRENIKCVLKYLKSHNDFEIIELYPFDFAKLTIKTDVHKDPETIACKYYFRLKLDFFRSYKNDPKMFNVNHIMVAVISINDFDKKIDEASFINKINAKKFNTYTVLPYSLITYRKPDIIKTQKLVKNIGVCTGQFSGDPSKEMFTWVDFQHSFGIGELMIYDGTINKTIREFINSNFENYQKKIKLTIVSDQSLFYEQCKEDIFYKQFENRNSSHLNDLLLFLCNKLHNWSHRSLFKRLASSNFWSYDRHKIIALNDCFIKLSRKFEFVGVYDFDEIIFPRTFDLVKDFYDKKTIYNCKNKKEICDRMPFYFKNKKSHFNRNYLYNYLISLIKKDEKNRPPCQLAAIQFDRSLTLSNPQIVEKDAFDMLETMIKQVNSSTRFPIYFNMINAFKFEILKKDIDYVNYLIESYKKFVLCIYRDHLKDIEIIDKDKVRAIFFLHEWGHILPKSIHYSKNIKTFDLHNATQAQPDTWIMFPSSSNGHFCSHYRTVQNPGDFNTVMEPIRNLNIDFEYMNFILKNYTEFC